MNTLDNGAALGRAFVAERNARDWKAYAMELERKLRTSEANTAGMEALKNAAMRELAKVDPANYLHIQQNRQRIFDAGFNPVASR
ncbi:hypothetical protein ACQUJV_19930 [Ralstonia pseudosolanacearum]